MSCARYRARKQAARSTPGIGNAIPILQARRPGGVFSGTGRVRRRQPSSFPQRDASATDPGASAVPAARSVLIRILGERAEDFDLAWIAPENGRQVYEVQASGGRVGIRGSSGVALSRGFYAYLREACNGMITWSGRHLPLPARFPDFAARRVVCPYRFVQYYNPCVFGYSTPFWPLGALGARVGLDGAPRNHHAARHGGPGGHLAIRLDFAWA